MSTKTFQFLSKGAEELARLVASMITILTALWLFGEPAVERWVSGLVEIRIAALREHVDDISERESALQTAITKQSAQIDNIEKLAAEQRMLSNQILLELRKP